MGAEASSATPSPSFRSPPTFIVNSSSFPFPPPSPRAMLVASPPSTLSSPPRSPAADDTLVRTTSQRGGPRPGLNRTHLTFGSPSSSYFPSSTSSSAVSSTSSTPTIQPATHHHPRSRSIPEPLNESEPLLSTAGLLLAPTGGRPLPAREFLLLQPSSRSKSLLLTLT